LIGLVSVSIVVGTAFVLSFECQSTGYCISPFVAGTTANEVLNMGPLYHYDCGRPILSQRSEHLDSQLWLGIYDYFLTFY